MRYDYSPHEPDPIALGYQHHGVARSRAEAIIALTLVQPCAVVRSPESGRSAGHASLPDAAHAETSARLGELPIHRPRVAIKEAGPGGTPGPGQ